MNHIQSLNFEGGGFQKIKDSGLATQAAKGEKILKFIPFKTYFIILTAISTLGLIGSIVDIFKGIGVLALPFLALQIPATALFGLYLKDESAKTRANLTTACCLNAVAVLVAFVMHVIKYISEMEIQKRDIFSEEASTYEDLDEDGKAKSDELLVQTRTAIISMYVWSTLFIILYILSLCAAKLHIKNSK